jgi:hypothetical protein
VQKPLKPYCGFKATMYINFDIHFEIQSPNSFPNLNAGNGRSSSFLTSPSV